MGANRTRTILVMGKTCILHVDINSYFAIMMQQENPSLRGRPVGVIKDKGRTVIIAASKEAKKRGVTTGCLVRDACKMCPGIILVPANFDFYLSATKKFHNLLKDISPDTEIFSLDEGFLDISHMRDHYPNVFSLGIKIQQLVKDKLGSFVTCNVGIGENRLLAKIAGEISPKGSVFEITERNKNDILSTISFRDVCGVGMALEAKLHALGVYNPYDINFLSDKILLKHFGPFWGKDLRAIGRGEESHVLRMLDHNKLPFRPAQNMKSVSRSITGFSLTSDEYEIRRVLYNLIDEVTFKARKMHLAGRYISVSLSGEGASWYNHKTLKRHISHTDEMFKVVYEDMYLGWRRYFKIIRFQVSLGMLIDSRNLTLSLFDYNARENKLYEALDKLSTKYGLFTVHSGLLTKSKLIRPEVTGYLGDKKYQSLAG